MVQNGDKKQGDTDRDARGRFLPGHSGERGKGRRGGAARAQRRKQLARLRARFDKEMEGLSIGEALRLAKVLKGLEQAEEGERTEEVTGAGERAVAEEGEDEGTAAALRVIGERKAAREETDED